VAAVAGAIYQHIATAHDERVFPMPGERIAIGGRSLHLYCSGSGAVTAVLENGLTASYPTWRLVQHGLETRMRVCSYDRAGLGFSDASPNATEARFVAGDLAALLTKAQIPPPYILVGWSAGGVFVRHYYHEHPGDVVGMVLVDSSHEQQRDRLPSNAHSAAAESALMDQLELCSAITWTGAVRLSGAMADVANRAVLPKDVAAEMLAMLNRTEYCAGIVHESKDFAPTSRVPHPPHSATFPWW
ncbi:MAG: alpha/beta hydrolase, partial [Gammaproteobacteria bacterium]|nr:alpha/beta hydrolase [Gammaproteobacteria bacterium]